MSPRPSAVLPLVALGAFVLVAATLRDPVRDAIPPPAPRMPEPEGRVLFRADFSDTSLAAWHADRPGVWSVRRGHLYADLPDEKQDRSFLAVGDSSWTDYAVDLDVCMMRGVDKGFAVRTTGTNGVGVDLRGPGYQDVVLQHGFHSLGRARVVNGNGTWHHLRLEARGDRFRLFVDGRLVIARKDRSSAGERGGIALAAYTGGTGECTVYYDNVLVTALR